MATTHTRPRGPRSHWLLGNGGELVRDPLDFFARIGREYGDVVGLRFLNVPGLFVNHPDLVEQVLVTEQRKFGKGPGYRRPFLFLGNGLLTSEGDFWLRQRRMMQPAFHRQRIAAYGETMVDFTGRMLDTWEDGEQRDLHRDFMRLTLTIVAKALFDVDASAWADRVGAALDTIMDHYVWMRASFVRSVLPLTFPFPANQRYHRAVAELDRTAYDVIAEHRTPGEDRGDLLSMLLEARDEDGAPMSDRQLRDEVLTLLLAGHETTANTLSWACWLLAQHPEAEARLLDELDQALHGQRPGLAHLPALAYTDSVIKETMRLYPASYAVTRQADAETRFGDYPVRPGTFIMFSQWALHRDARYFDEPERFCPERWLDGLEKRLPRYAYFPFGGGPRMCIGNQFAMMEAVLVLAAVLQRFRISVAPGHAVIPQPAITLRPKNGIHVVVRRRPATFHDAMRKDDV